MIIYANNRRAKIIVVESFVRGDLQSREFPSTLEDIHFRDSIKFARESGHGWPQCRNCIIILSRRNDYIYTFTRKVLVLGVRLKLSGLLRERERIRECLTVSRLVSLGRVWIAAAY